MDFFTLLIILFIVSRVVEAFVKYLDRNKKPMVPSPIMINAGLSRLTVEARTCPMDLPAARRETITAVAGRPPARNRWWPP